MRLNKEIELDSCKNLSLKFGSINKKDPQIIYVSAKMWICPTYEGDFKTPINIIYKGFKNELSKALKNSVSFEHKHILDFDINPDNLVCNKKKFFSISFFVKQKKEKILSLSNVKHLVNSEFGYLFNDLENELIKNDFLISKKK